MSYTNAYFKNDELDFPHPPLWLVWTCNDRTSQSEWNVKKDPETARAVKGQGKIRHVPTLDKAKRQVSRYGLSKRNLEYANRPNSYWGNSPNGGDWSEGEWMEDWAIYEWVDNQYVLRYEAKAGEFKQDTELFKKPVKKGTGEKIRTVPEEAIEAAKQSILRAV